MSTSKHLFDNYILLGQPVTVELASTAQLTILLGCLRVYKSRYEEQLRKLDMSQDSLLIGQSISYKILESKPTGEITVEIFTSKSSAKSNLSFKIIQ